VEPPRARPGASPEAWHPSPAAPCAQPSRARQQPGQKRINHDERVRRCVVRPTGRAGG
jgi:hypothetical protein